MEDIDAILQAVEETVMGKRLKGLSQRLTYRNRKSQKPRDLWPLRECSLGSISCSLSYSYWLFIPLYFHIVSTHPTSSASVLLTSYASPYLIHPLYSGSPSISLPAKATPKLELLLYLLQSCCLCCVWTLPPCWLTCLNCWFSYVQRPFTVLFMCCPAHLDFNFHLSLEDL